MNERLATLATTHAGIFTRAQAIACGYDDSDIYRAVQKRQWQRIRRGCYADAAGYAALDPVGRHLASVHAVLLSLPGDIAFSHCSAAALYGCDMWDVDLSCVHVTRLDGCSGRREGDVIHHVGDLGEEDLRYVDGIPVVTPARALVETASIAGFEAGVVAADSALRDGLVTSEQLLAGLEQARSWPGSRNACAVTTFADGRSESVGESRARVMFHQLDLPAPELQYPIHDRLGELVARVDFYFEAMHTVVEFDGRLKYTSQEPDVLYREKRREDRIRELGYGVARMSWSDLSHPGYTATRIRRAAVRSATALN